MRFSLGKKGVGIVDTVAAVTLLGLLALGSIKFLDIRYSKKDDENNSISQKISVKILSILNDGKACKKTFEGKNIVRTAQTFSSIKNQVGKEIYKLNDVLEL